MSEALLLNAIESIYAAVERPELWPEAISAIGMVVGGGAAFWALDEPNSGPGINVLRNSCRPTFFLSQSDLKELDEYSSEFGSLITRFLTAVYISMLWSQSDVTARETIGLRMVQRYLPAIGSAADRTPKTQTSNRVLRNLIATLWEEGYIFGANNVRSMQLLASHLDRALSLQMRLGAAELRSGMLSGALDCLTLGVVFVSRSGRPLWINRRAQEIVDQKALCLSPSGLAAQSAPETRSLRELIDDTVSKGSQGLLAISRRMDQRPLVLIAVPLSPVGLASDRNDTVNGVLFISDPDQIDEPKMDSVRRAFGLTYREAQMAIAISHGQGLQAAAESLGVAVTTARSQLQAVFAKTETKHQAEVAALINRTLAAVRVD